jgi:hypothetical protein
LDEKVNVSEASLRERDLTLGKNAAIPSKEDSTSGILDKTAALAKPPNVDLDLRFIVTSIDS